MEGSNQSTTTVQPVTTPSNEKKKVRYKRYDVVTLKDGSGQQKIILRRDGTLKYNKVTDTFSKDGGDDWSDYTEDIIQYLEKSLQEKGYIEL
tara:strand:- start:583 stop:858 length:276 start_codon:yes stop_codon:yes gene_type:complete